MSIDRSTGSAEQRVNLHRFGGNSITKRARGPRSRREKASALPLMMHFADSTPNRARARGLGAAESEQGRSSSERSWQSSAIIKLEISGQRDRRAGGRILNDSRSGCENQGVSVAFPSQAGSVGSRGGHVVLDSAQQRHSGALRATA